MRSMRQYYTREHPFWPSNKEEALDEISDLNDLLGVGGWSKVQRDWLYSRRAKLIRFLNDPEYQKHTLGVTKPIMDSQKASSIPKGDGNEE